MTVETPRGVVIENPRLERFELLHEGDVVSFARYRRDENRLFIDHVETDPARRGNDFAAELLEGLLVMVRAADQTVVPLCGFAAAHIRANPDHHDLLD